MPRVFTSENTRQALVYDVDTMQELTRVRSIDIDTGEVTRYHEPLRVVGDEVATYTERYRSIHPVYGGSPFPVLFHCYDRNG